MALMLHFNFFFTLILSFSVTKHLDVFVWFFFFWVLIYFFLINFGWLLFVCFYFLENSFGLISHAFCKYNFNKVSIYTQILKV